MLLLALRSGLPGLPYQNGLVKLKTNKKMKTLNLLLLISVLLVGCRSTKKLTESSAVVSNQTETVEKVDVKEETKVNNDKSTFKKTTIIKTVYDTQIKPSKPLNTTSGTIEPSKPNNPVLSTEVTVIEEGTKDNSVVETKKADNSEIETKTEDKIKVENSTVEKKSVPIRWGWIFGCLVLVFVVFIYFSKSGIAIIVKTFIKKLFA